MNEIVLTILGGSLSASIVTAVSTFFINVYNQKKAEEKADNNVIAGLRIILYYDIKQACKKHIAAGEISTDDLEDILKMHKYYHDNLNGNGYLDEIINKVKKLQITSN